MKITNQEIIHVGGEWNEIQNYKMPNETSLFVVKNTMIW